MLCFAFQFSSNQNLNLLLLAMLSDQFSLHYGSCCARLFNSNTHQLRVRRTAEYLCKSDITILGFSCQCALAHERPSALLLQLSDIASGFKVAQLLHKRCKPYLLVSLLSFAKLKKPS